MALPGGKRERADKDLKATVTRETLEETGIDLSDGRFLGVLPPVRSTPKRDLLILPFVILLEKEPRIRLSSSELEAYIWVSYEKIVSSRGKATIPSIGEVSAYLVTDAVVVWGITYRILKAFSEAVGDIKKQ